jgi:hypothetical protein
VAKKDETVQRFPDFWRFPAASTAQLRDRLNGAPDGATLRVVPYDKEGRKELMLYVDAPQDAVTAESHEPGINESHACPPACGG